MGSLSAGLLFFLVLAAIAVTAIVIALRGTDRSVGVRPSFELTPQDGWSLLNLVLKNGGDSKVWIERVAFVLDGLDAEMQSTPATGQGALEVREFVDSEQTLRFSLIEAVYNAAGKPQGGYDFEIAGAVLCRQGGKRIECEVPRYKVSMVRLSAGRLRRLRARSGTPQSLDRLARLRPMLRTTIDTGAKSIAPNPQDERPVHGQGTGDQPREMAAAISRRYN